MNQREWDDLVTKANGSFLQSWAWGELQKAEGVKYWRLSEQDQVALVIKREMKLGKSWLYVPRGKLGGELLEKIVGLARKEKAVFVRVDSQITSPPARWRKAKQEVQPRETLVVNLSKTEEELLGEMRAKTRYNIRLAAKKGVTVRFSKEKKYLERFLELAKEVTGRSEFNYHSPTHFEKMLEVLGKADMLELAAAEYQSDILAVHFLIYFSDTVTYLHGASSSQRREVMAPHLLQWESMRRAKQMGFKYYDFWGVGAQWPGITRFKEGFGGERREYAGAYDLALDKFWYWLYNVWHK